MTDQQESQQPDKRERIETHPVRTHADRTPQVSPQTLAKLRQEHPEWFQKDDGRFFRSHEHHSERGAAAKREWRQPSPDQLGCEQQLEKLLKAFIPTLQSGNTLRVATQDEQDTLAQKIAPLFVQAEQLGKQYASKQLSRGLGSTIGGWIQRASDLVARAIDWAKSLFESKVEQLGDDATEEDVEQALEDVASNVAETLATTEIQDIIEETVFAAFEAAQVAQVEWVCEPDACDECLEMQARGPMPIAHAERPPKHNRCRCHLDSV